MKTSVGVLLLVSILNCVGAAESQLERSYFVPVVSQEQKPSLRMQAVLAEFKRTAQLEQLRRCDVLAELPGWVFEANGCESYTVLPSPMLVHGFRYSILLRGSGEIIVVRAGGLDDAYSYFRVRSELH